MKIGLGYEVKTDLYDIAARLREIDPCYRVYYSYVDKRYEVHDCSAAGNTLCLAVPYDKLDARTLLLVKRTRIERIDALMKEMERENEKKSKAQREKIVLDVAKAAERVYSGA